jgi:hypothetical protein
MYAIGRKILSLPLPVLFSLFNYWYWCCSTYCTDFASTGINTELILKDVATSGTVTVLLS